MITILARFRTHELAMRAYFELELSVQVSMPSLEESTDGRPWVMTVAYNRGQQPLVLAIVGRYGGVTFQEGEHGEGGVPAAHLPGAGGG